jgi:hypothetical protein
MKDWIKKIFSKEKTNPFPNSKHVIKHAFEVGGVDYYEFDEVANLPFKRGLKFLSIYNELDMRCDRFYLLKHTEAIENILTGGKRVGFDEMMKIRELNMQLKERLEMVFQEDLVYKVASVVFFDKNENPNDWEWGYAMKKIEHWKQHKGVHDFFLQEPIQRLIPFLNGGALNFQIYSEVSKQIDAKHLESVYSNLSESLSKISSNSMERYFWTEMNQSGV